MSQEQLDAVIADVAAVFGGWAPDTSIEQIREDWDNLFSDVVPLADVKSEPVNAGGVKATWFTPPDARINSAVLYLHGGGYVLGSVHSHRAICERLALGARVRVLALDYRLAPENPFPSQVEDAVAAYEWLLAQGVTADRMAISGDSAGGGLSLATLLALKNNGRPLPACAALMSPWVDMEILGETITTNDAIDPMIHRPMIEVMVSLFVNENDRRNPLANPLYGDFSGLPPLLIHVGGRETLESDSQRVAQKAKDAGVSTELKLWPNQIHVFHIFAGRLDEGNQAVAELAQFIASHIG